jgi:hypothetical protein
MARCPSSQDILTAAVLRQKWIEAVSAEVIEVYESSSGKANLSTQIRKLQAFIAEKTNSAAIKRHHFKGRSSLLRALDEALAKAKAVADNDEKNLELFQQLSLAVRAAAASSF